MRLKPHLGSDRRFAMSTMTSRERILKAVNHQEADRIPIDIGGTQQTSLHRVAQNRLLNYLGYEPHEDMFDLVQQLNHTAPQLAERFGADCRIIMPGAPDNWTLDIREDDGAFYFTDEWRITYKMPKGSGLYFDVWDSPLKSGTMEALNNYKYPDPKDPGRIAGLREQAKKLYEETDQALLIADGTWGLMLHSAVLMGFQTFYKCVAKNETLVRSLFEKNLEFELAYWEALLPEIKNYVQFVTLSDDLGSQYGPIINPKTYREWLKPLHQQLIAYIKKNSDLKIFFHSCGAISDFIPDLIEVGVDALNPVQITAHGMGSAWLKKEFGKDITFWGGGIDTQHVLSGGTPEQVRGDVLKRLEHFGPGGGFVFSPIHNVQADVPPENIVAMYETVIEYGRYPLNFQTVSR